MSTIQTYPLERVKILKKWIASMFGLTILFVIIAVVSALAFSANLWAISSVCILLLLLLAIWQAWYENAYYKNYFYDFQPKQMVIRKGVITSRETTLPYTKIQDVYMDQDLLDRIFGLWDVHVSTPTVTSGVEAHLDGVNRKNAVALRDAILKQMHGKKGR